MPGACEGMASGVAGVPPLGGFPATAGTPTDVFFAQAREQVARTVNSGMVGLYWHIGRRIRKHLLLEQRAEYGSPRAAGPTTGARTAGPAKPVAARETGRWEGEATLKTFHPNRRVTPWPCCCWRWGCSGS